MKCVIAIGGNALVTPGKGNIADQFARSRQLAKTLADVIQQGCQITLTHGNGPQVGSVMRRVEISSNEVYPIDLGLAVADTQAGMGYMLCQTLRNELAHRGIDRPCVAIVTTVEVDRDDPAFGRPTKPVGSFFSAEAAEHHRSEHGWDVMEDAGRGYRRVVASPRPLRIVQLPVIKHLVDAGFLLVAAGGGGVPVIVNEAGEHHGVEAVIDKDLTSALLAAEIESDALVLVTGVESVYINYNRPEQEALRNVTVDQLEGLIREGHFAEGSMLPKIQAALQFIRKRDAKGARAVITDWSHISQALDGSTGTTLTL
ncbi:MAG: carbamate kinase [Planctomycetota bacterium]|nr:carbamate kinase [Planctomycetota bacterium]